MSAPSESRSRDRSKRFAARLVVAFFVSAAVPVLAFSTLVYFSTRSQLEEEAGAALRREAKDAAMAVLERITIGEDRLRVWEPAEPGTSVETRRTLFTSVVAAEMDAADLWATDRARLEDGQSLLRVVDSGAGVDVRLMVPREGRVVIGTFAQSYLFAPERLGPDESYWVTASDDQLIFGVQPNAEGLVEPMLQSPILGGEGRRLVSLGSGEAELIGVVWPLFLQLPYDLAELRVGMARSKASVLRPLQDFSRIFYATMGITLLVSGAFALRQIRVRVGPLEVLTAAVKRVEAGELGSTAHIESGDEFEMLGAAFDSMSTRLRIYFDAVQDMRLAAEALLSSTTSEDVGNVVVPSLLSLTPAINVSLFTGDREGLREVAVDPAVQGGCGDPEAIVARSAFVRHATSLDDPAFFHRIEGEAPEAWTCFDRAYGQRAESLLLIPLTATQGEAHGALMVTFAEGSRRLSIDDDEIKPIFVVAAQAGVALSHVHLLDSLRKLFEGVIDLTVDAIDEKSAYTGDHCRRVPILAEMITDAVCDTESGRFKDFCFTEDERYELKIAALLHDCGKVATPVHVMDKATKLEKIVDRIETIRLRAEILGREIALARLRGEGDASNSPAFDEADLRDACEFLASVNVGGEYMSDEKMNRVDEIAATFTWTEADGTIRSLVDPDEARNLKISRGTLNDEEREEINNHVITTMRLLERLPFPESMRNVPAIAGAHHERVDGTGYPLGLGGENLSLQGRILGLADIFEALTAKDRPYKPGKTLSETLQILEAMAEDGHVDRDLHDLILREKIHIDYAARHMAPEQIDEPFQDALEQRTAEWEPA